MPLEEQEESALCLKSCYGPISSKLATSLERFVKISNIKFEIRQYFLLKKCEKLLQASLIFSSKNIIVFGYKVVKHLTS